MYMGTLALAAQSKELHGGRENRGKLNKTKGNIPRRSAPAKGRNKAPPYFAEQPVLSGSRSALTRRTPRVHS